MGLLSAPCPTDTGWACRYRQAPDAALSLGQRHEGGLDNRCLDPVRGTAGVCCSSCPASIFTACSAQSCPPLSCELLVRQLLSVLHSTVGARAAVTCVRCLLRACQKHSNPPRSRHALHKHPASRSATAKTETGDDRQLCAARARSVIAPTSAKYQRVSRRAFC